MAGLWERGRTGDGPGTDPAYPPYRIDASRRSSPLLSHVLARGGVTAQALSAFIRADPRFPRSPKRPSPAPVRERRDDRGDGGEGEEEVPGGAVVGEAE